MAVVFNILENEIFDEKYIKKNIISEKQG